MLKALIQFIKHIKESKKINNASKNDYASGIANIPKQLIIEKEIDLFVDSIETTTYISKFDLKYKIGLLKDTIEWKLLSVGEYDYIEPGAIEAFIVIELITRIDNIGACYEILEHKDRKLLDKKVI